MCIKRWAFAFALVLTLGASAKGRRKCIHRFYDIRKHANFHRLPMDTCGENNSDRIVGGQAAALGEFPWMCRIAYKLGNCSSPMEFRCGGALITPNVVITAAHCSTNLPINRCQADGNYAKYYPCECFQNIRVLPPPLQIGMCIFIDRDWDLSYLVRLGENVIKTDPDCQQDVCAAKVQDIEIAKIIVHPKYDIPKLRHDIAILQLKANAEFNGWVNALCMIAKDVLTVERYLNQTGIVAGWGIINTKTQEVSKELMKLYVPVVPIEQCVEAYDKRATLSTSQQLCAGGIKGQDSCSGDSGGPLFIIDDNDYGPRYHILGVVSFGFKKCAEMPVPAVYTNVLYYGKFIMDNL